VAGFFRLQARFAAPGLLKKVQMQGGERKAE
jgi:hypothetical protein